MMLVLKSSLIFCAILIFSTPVKCAYIPEALQDFQVNTEIFNIYMFKYLKFYVMLKLIDKYFLFPI